MSSITAPPTMETIKFINRFGYNLFEDIFGISADQGNIFISPFSVAIALSMTLKGASGKAKEELQASLCLYGIEEDSIHEACKYYLSFLDKMDESIILEVANSLWGNKLVKFKKPFIKTLTKEYFSRIESKDFSDPLTLTQINQWVSEKTHGKIEKILEDLSNDHLMVILNAIYFKSKWSSEFKKNNTKNRNFNYHDKPPKEIPMMEQFGEFPYTETKYAQIIHLPYGDNKELSMKIYLPKEDVSLEEVQELYLCETEESSQVKWLVSKAGTIVLPKFKFEATYDLIPYLKDLGVRDLFKNDNTPKLGGMTDSPAFVDLILHKTYIEVNEEGTEAAAVTAVRGILCCASIPIEPIPPFKMVCDRPFLFTITERKHNINLFVGSVIDPKE